MKPLLTPLICFLTLSAIAQSKESFYVFNEHWKPTVIDSATYMIYEYQRKDGNWECNYYQFMGPLIKVETYKGHDWAVPNGRFEYFDDKGNIDSSGQYINGKKDGPFYRYETTGRDSLIWKTEYIYRMDTLVETIDLAGRKRGRDKDSAREKESEFPGGTNHWIRFLTNSLKYPDRAANNSIEGMVKIVFMVDENGIPTEPRVVKSREYSLDREALRMIGLSGKWVPGVKDGKIVKTYKKQPIVFRLGYQ
jgi:TonB family protein